MYPKIIIYYGCKDKVMHFTVKCRLIHKGLQIQLAHLITLM